MRPGLFPLAAAAVVALFSIAKAENAAPAAPDTSVPGAAGKTGAGAQTAPPSGAGGAAQPGKGVGDRIGNFGSGLDRGVGSGAGSTGMRGGK